MTNPTPAKPINPDGYFARSREPLQALIFLLPLLIAYEVGTLILATDPETGVVQANRARVQLGWMYDLFGTYFYFLPGIIVIIVLVTLHLIRQDRWSFNPWVYLAMAVESALLAFPILVLALIMLGRPATGMAESDGNWQVELVFSIGAGIYEELLFRLILITLLHLIIVDLLHVHDIFGALLAVVLSSAAFAMYHFSSFDAIEWHRFRFFVAAGVYLAFVYLMRGFGVVVGAHAIYDVIVVALAYDFVSLRT